MQELYHKVAGNSILQKKINQILSEAESAGPAATEEKLLDFAREAGFEVSVEEMRTFFEGMSTQASGELSDAELDQVAGGKSKTGTENVIISVLTVGVGCAIGSIIEEVKSQGACNWAFQ
jgi:predicted ribosomally synthesized peptide with nif11-like leader